jgi:hypothetical protein
VRLGHHAAFLLRQERDQRGGGDRVQQQERRGQRRQPAHRFIVREHRKQHRDAADRQHAERHAHREEPVDVGGEPVRVLRRVADDHSVEAQVDHDDPRRQERQRGADLAERRRAEPARLDHRRDEADDLRQRRPAEQVPEVLDDGGEQAAGLQAFRS